MTRKLTIKFEPPPKLSELGRDLLELTTGQRVLTLALPFIFVGIYFYAAFTSHWLIAVASVAYLSVTSYIPHDASGRNELEQTRVFRGRLLSILAVEHLYHLEHHLYPSIPHQNWPSLARRLDPYFDRVGIKPVRLGW